MNRMMVQAAVCEAERQTGVMLGGALDEHMLARESSPPPDRRGGMEDGNGLPR